MHEMQKYTKKKLNKCKKKKWRNLRVLSRLNPVEFQQP